MFREIIVEFSDMFHEYFHVRFKQKQKRADIEWIEQRVCFGLMLTRMRTKQKLPCNLYEHKYLYVNSKIEEKRDDLSREIAMIHWYNVQSRILHESHTFHRSVAFFAKIFTLTTSRKWNKSNDSFIDSHDDPKLSISW